MGKEYLCPKCGGGLAPYSSLKEFLRCQICGLAVRLKDVEARAAEESDGETA